jgi:hypothetical protein
MQGAITGPNRTSNEASAIWLTDSFPLAQHRSGQRHQQRRCMLRRVEC